MQRQEGGKGNGGNIRFLLISEGTRLHIEQKLFRFWPLRLSFSNGGQAGRPWMKK